MNTEKMIAETLLQIKALKSEIAELRAVVIGSAIQAEGWTSAKDAAVALRSEGIKNMRQLQQLRLKGAFSEGRGEIRDVGKGNRPVWQYHIPKCKTALRRYFK